MARGNNLTYRELVAKGGLKSIDGTEGDDIISVSRDVKSKWGSSTRISLGSGSDTLRIGGELSAKGTNTISAGDGAKNIYVAKGIEAEKGGINEILLGAGEHVLTFGKDMEADYGSVNRIKAGAGNADISIRGEMEGHGLNEILVGDGTHNINIKGMDSDRGGVNRIVTEGTTTITMKKGLETEGGLNEIITGKGNDEIILDDGMSAEKNGINRISTGAGDDRIIIGDGVEAKKGGHNYINTGEGNDYIYIDDGIQRGSLTIDAGEGHDTLVLHSRYSWEFNLDYSGWFNDLSSSDGLASTGLETIQVDIGTRYSLNQIDWLTQIINDHNTKNPTTAIDLELNLDAAGRYVDFDTLFTDADESSITGIDLSGHSSNVLRIGGNLSDTGYDNDTLRVTGDHNDSVELASDWKAGDTFVDDTGMTFNVYTNGGTDELLIQVGMGVSYV